MATQNDDYEIEYIEYAEEEDNSSLCSDAVSSTFSDAASTTSTTFSTTSSVPEEPYLCAEEVTKLAQKGTFLVIDNAVYDLTTFEAPSYVTQMLYKSLNGTDCSWQFWKLHSSQQWEAIQPHRIGVTSGVRQKYAPPKERFFSIRKNTCL